MQTHFSLAQLADPDLAEANKILRACVHCGFCTATCPTYVLTGNELDSPRGRIYLIKDMLENDRAATPTDVTHLDRCLSCLSCMTTCPSGVNYMHLVDQGRAHVEKTVTRPAAERLLRRALGWVMPSPSRFRLALAAARLAIPVARFLPLMLRRSLDLLPLRAPTAAPATTQGIYPAEGARRYRVALLRGCVQNVLAPEIDSATVRLLTRHGCEVVVAARSGCCGALNHHLGQTDKADGYARANIAAWSDEISGDGLDAIIVNTSGCGTMVKDYGYLFRADDSWADRAARISEKARDISEFMDQIGLREGLEKRSLSVVYQSPCSLRHGQKVIGAPADLLSDCGFEVFAAPEPHLCCVSAGIYNILQPGLAGRLRARKTQ
ncbi:MAG: glycolate oxidase subunit GlcF, partial [Alphaproteobacteria bacterium]